MSDRLNDAITELASYRQQVGRGQHAAPDLFTALESVLDHAGDVWRDQALDALRLVAESMTEFSVADVTFPPTIDNRAVGAILVEGKRRGWMKPIGYMGGGA